MGDVGILQESYVAGDIAGDADVPDLLQGTPVLPNSNRDQMRHVAVVIRGHSNGQTSQNHIWFHFQSEKRRVSTLKSFIFIWTKNSIIQGSDTNDNQLRSLESQFRRPCLIQCERALPSDCQKDAVSPFVILQMSATLDDASIEL